MLQKYSCINDCTISSLTQTNLLDSVQFNNVYTILALSKQLI